MRLHPLRLLRLGRLRPPGCPIPGTWGCLGRRLGTLHPWKTGGGTRVHGSTRPVSGCSSIGTTPANRALRCRGRWSVGCSRCLCANRSAWSSTTPPRQRSTRCRGTPRRSRASPVGPGWGTRCSPPSTTPATRCGRPVVRTSRSNTRRADRTSWAASSTRCARRAFESGSIFRSRTGTTRTIRPSPRRTSPMWSARHRPGQIRSVGSATWSTCVRRSPNCSPDTAGSTCCGSTAAGSARTGGPTSSRRPSGGCSPTS